jgi:hypothetical protein
MNQTNSTMTEQKDIFVRESIARKQAKFVCESYIAYPQVQSDMELSNDDAVHFAIIAQNLRKAFVASKNHTLAQLAGHEVLKKQYLYQRATAIAKVEQLWPLLATKHVWPTEWKSE